MDAEDRQGVRDLVPIRARVRNGGEGDADAANEVEDWRQAGCRLGGGRKRKDKSEGRGVQSQCPCMQRTKRRAGGFGLAPEVRRDCLVVETKIVGYRSETTQWINHRTVLIWSSCSTARCEAAESVEMDVDQGEKCLAVLAESQCILHRSLRWTADYAIRFSAPIRA